MEYSYQSAGRGEESAQELRCLLVRVAGIGHREACGGQPSHNYDFVSHSVISLGAGGADGCDLQGYVQNMMCPFVSIELSGRWVLFN